MTKSDTARRLFTLSEAASKLGQSVRTLQRRIDAGQIEAVIDGGRPKVQPEEIDRYIAALPRKQAS